MYENIGRKVTDQSLFTHLQRALQKSALTAAEMYFFDFQSVLIPPFLMEL